MEDIEFIETKKSHSLITKIIIILLIILCIYFIKNNKKQVEETNAYSEQSVAEDPIQIPIDSNDTIVKQIDADYVCIMHPKASYVMNVKIKAINTMNLNDPIWRQKLSKYDLGVVWGKLADVYYDKYIEYSQINRFLTWTYKLDIGLSSDYILSHVSNNHIIPANDNIILGIQTLKVNDICCIEGKLVDFEIKNGIKNIANMKTSLVRTDLGDGACETIYVQKITIGDKIYE